MADASEVEILQDALRAMDAEVSRLREALEIIAGRRQCIDNLLGNKDVAILALDRHGRIPGLSQSTE